MSKRKRKTPGAEARDQGINRIADHYPEWVEGALLDLQKLFGEKAQITADDLRHLTFPHPNCIGAVFRIASQRKLIKSQGFTLAQTTSCHSRAVRIWVKATPP